MAAAAVVDELQGEVELLALQQRDDRLQIVLLLGRDAEFLALDLGPDSLRPLVPDDLGDLLGVVLGDALLEGHAHPVLLAGKLRVACVQGLERDAALDQFVLEDVQDRLGAFLAVGADVDGVLAGPGDRGADAAEVEPGADLLGRLVDRVVNFLAVELGHDVAVPSKYNFGVRWRPWNWLEADLSWQRGNQIGVNLSAAFDLGVPMIPLYDHPYREKPEHRLSPVEERIARGLAGHRLQRHHRAEGWGPPRGGGAERQVLLHAAGAFGDAPGRGGADAGGGAV